MRVRRAWTAGVGDDPDFERLISELSQPDIGLIFLFAGATAMLAACGSALARRFPAARIVGCSSFGQIGPAGYAQGGVSGCSIHRDDLCFEIGLAESCSSLESRRAKALAHNLRERLRNRMAGLSGENGFAFMIIDGQSRREELVARAFHDGLDGIRMVGGSAGGGQVRGSILCDSLVVEDAALLLVGSSPFLFEVFKTQDYLSTDKRMVVTEASPGERIVREINGLPAAGEYARLLGIRSDTLDAVAFSEHPLIVRIGGTDFIRSIESAGADGALRFYCGVEEGNVFRLSRPVDATRTLDRAFEDVIAHIGGISFVLGCDCCLRQIAIERHGVRDAIDSLLCRHRVTGFASGGEQFCGTHVNQTFTGIAFGRRTAP